MRITFAILLLCITTACSRSDDAEVRAKADKAAQDLKEAGRDLKHELKQAGAEAKHELKQAGDEIEREAKKVKRDVNAEIDKHRP